MHDRFKYIKNIPRLRRLSVSPWAELRPIAEQCGRDYVLCRKPNPAPVCSPGFDEAVIRRDLKETLEAMGHLNMEIIMKDTHTVMNEPWRIPRWVELAREEVERYLNNR